MWFVNTSLTIIMYSFSHIVFLGRRKAKFTRFLLGSLAAFSIFLHTNNCHFSVSFFMANKIEIKKVPHAEENVVSIF